MRVDTPQIDGGQTPLTQKERGPPKQQIVRVQVAAGVICPADMVGRNASVQQKQHGRDRLALEIRGAITNAAAGDAATSIQWVTKSVGRP